MFTKNCSIQNIWNITTFFKTKFIEGHIICQDLLFLGHPVRLTGKTFWYILGELQLCYPLHLPQGILNRQYVGLTHDIIPRPGYSKIVSIVFHPYSKKKYYQLTPCCIYLRKVNKQNVNKLNQCDKNFPSQSNWRWYIIDIQLFNFFPKFIF